MDDEKYLAIDIDALIDANGTDCGVASFVLCLLQALEQKPDYEIDWAWTSFQGDFERHTVLIWVLSRHYFLAFVPDFLGRAAILPRRGEKGETIEESLRVWLESLPSPSRYCVVTYLGDVEL